MSKYKMKIKHQHYNYIKMKKKVMNIKRVLFYIKLMKYNMNSQNKTHKDLCWIQITNK